MVVEDGENLPCIQSHPPLNFGRSSAPQCIMSQLSSPVFSILCCIQQLGAEQPVVMCILHYVLKLIHVLVVIGTLSHLIFHSSNCQRVATLSIPHCGPSCAVRYPHRQVHQSMNIAYHCTLQWPTSGFCDYHTLGHFTCVLTYPLTCRLLDPTTIASRSLPPFICSSAGSPPSHCHAPLPLAQPLQSRSLTHHRTPVHPNLCFYNTPPHR